MHALIGDIVVQRVRIRGTCGWNARLGIRSSVFGIIFNDDEDGGKPLAAASSRSRQPSHHSAVEEWRKNREMDSCSNGVFERRGSLGSWKELLYGEGLRDNIDLSSLLIQTLMETGSNYVIVRGEVRFKIALRIFHSFHQFGSVVNSVTVLRVRYDYTLYKM